MSARVRLFTLLFATPLVARADDLIELLQQRNCTDCRLAEWIWCTPTCGTWIFKELNCNAPTSDKLASMEQIYGEATFSSPTYGGHPYAALI